MELLVNRISLVTREANFHLSDDLTVAGPLSNGTVWERSPLRVYPACHRMVPAMTLRLQVAPSRGRAPKLIFYTAHFSVGYDPSTRKGNFVVAGTTDLDITVPLRAAVRPGVYDVKLLIDWAEDGGRPIGSTGWIKFKVCLVLGTPTVEAGSLSYGRLLHAFEMVNLAGSSEPHTLIAAIHGLLPGYQAQANLPDPWTVASHFQAGRRQFVGLVVDCQSMVRYMKWILDLLGFSPATERDVVVVFACPVKPHVVLESRLQDGGEPHCQNPDVHFGDIYSREVPPFRLTPDIPYDRGRLLDGHAHLEAALLDRGSNPNNYEACLKLTHNGVTRYYPGGVGAALNDRLAVIRVFARMGWRLPNNTWIDHYNYRTQVLTTYAEGDVQIALMRRLPLVDGGIVANAAAVRGRMAVGGEF